MYYIFRHLDILLWNMNILMTKDQQAASLHFQTAFFATRFVLVVIVYIEYYIQRSHIYSNILVIMV